MIPYLLQFYKGTCKFYNRVRAEGKTIDNYIASLWGNAKYCVYGNTFNIMLRDCLVCGINHHAIQRRLLAEKNLTFEKALEISLAVEAADKDMKQIQKPPVNSKILYQSLLERMYSLVAHIILTVTMDAQENMLFKLIHLNKLSAINARK